MPSGIRIAALCPDLFEVAGSDQPHEGTRDFTVVCICGAPKLGARVGVVVACDAFTEAMLERIQISFRVVCHVAFVRIDSGEPYPPIKPPFPRNSSAERARPRPRPRSPTPTPTLALALALTLALTLTLAPRRADALRRPRGFAGT